jgi:predicted nucleotidyltransferase
MDDGLKEQERARIREVLDSESKVRRAVIFGSRAMGTFRPSSDLDLALEGDAMHLADLARIKSKLAEQNMAIDVDLIVRDTIGNTKLEDHIQTFGREWYRKKEEGTGGHHR